MINLDIQPTFDAIYLLILEIIVNVFRRGLRIWAFVSRSCSRFLDIRGRCVSEHLPASPGQVKSSWASKRCFWLPIRESTGRFTRKGYFHNYMYYPQTTHTIEKNIFKKLFNLLYGSLVTAVYVCLKSIRSCGK